MAAAIRAQLGSIACEEGDTNTARTLITGSLAFWETRGHLRWIAGTERRLSVVALREGHLDEAAQRAEHSRTLYGEVGDRLGEARASFALANVLVQSGAKERANNLYREARAYAEAFELAPFANRIRSVLNP